MHSFRFTMYIIYGILLIVILPCVLILTGNNTTQKLGKKMDMFPTKFEEQNVKNTKIPVGLNYAGIKELWDKNLKGKGVKIGVVDSGIQNNHNEFKDTQITTRNKIPDTFDGSNVHGTHVAGTIAASGKKIFGAAPEAKLVDYRIFANEKTSKQADRISGDIGLLISSLDDAYSDGCHIVNLSLGIPIDYPPVRNAISRAFNRGITIVCAAGNRNKKTENTSYPALYPTVISVGAIKIENSTVKKTPFSMDNSGVNIWADGNKVLSTLPHNKYGLLSGTSMASPLVAGTIASYFSELISKGKKPSPHDAFEFIRNHTKQDNGVSVLRLQNLKLKQNEISDEEVFYNIEATIASI